MNGLISAKNSCDSNRGRFAVGFTERSKAAGIHFAVSAAASAGVLALVFLGWYPGPLDRISGVGEVLLLLLAVDVVLGPFLTLVVFDRSKKSLWFDLSCIAAMQVAALIYGLYAIEAGRPHYLVFVKDRFEVVSRADLETDDRTSAEGNRAADVSWFSPSIVAAEMPSSEQARKDVLFESVVGGRDIQHFPTRYREYASQATLAASKGMSLQELRAINPDGDRVLQLAIRSSRLPEDRVKFLPIKGPKGDAAMLVDASIGAIAGMVALQPWR